MPHSLDDVSHAIPLASVCIETVILLATTQSIRVGQHSYQDQRRFSTCVGACLSRSAGQCSLCRRWATAGHFVKPQDSLSLTTCLCVRVLVCASPAPALLSPWHPPGLGGASHLEGHCQTILPLAVIPLAHSLPSLEYIVDCITAPGSGRSMRRTRACKAVSRHWCRTLTGDHDCSEPRRLP